MGNRNSRNISRREVSDILMRSAGIYHKYFSGVVFLYAFKGTSIEVQFRAESFKHLSGVKSPLRGKEFFSMVRKGKFQDLQLNFSDWHFRTYFPRKSQYIDKLHQLTIGTCNIVEGIETETRQFEFGLTDCNFTVGLSRNFDMKGKLRNPYLVPYSLRDGDGRSISRESYPVEFVLRKRIGQKKYDTLCYINPAFNGKIADTLSSQMVPNIEYAIRDTSALKKWQMAQKAFLQTFLKASPRTHTDQKQEIKELLCASARQALLHDGIQKDVKDWIQRYAPAIVRDEKDFAQRILDKALQNPAVEQIVHPEKEKML